MYEVELITRLEQLPKELWDAYDWELTNHRHVLLIKLNGKIIQSECDGGEPEDQSFLRDWSWVKIALLEAYKIGKIEGLTEALWQSMEHLML